METLTSLRFAILLPIMSLDDRSLGATKGFSVYDGLGSTVSHINTVIHTIPSPKRRKKPICYRTGYPIGKQTNTTVCKGTRCEGSTAQRRGVEPKFNQEIETSASAFLISASLSISSSCVACNLFPLHAFSLSSSIALSYLCRRQGQQAGTRVTQT